MTIWAILGDLIAGQAQWTLKHRPAAAIAILLAVTAMLVLLL